MIAYLDLVVAGAVSGIPQKRTLAHAPFTHDQCALSSPGGAAFQIDFPYHNLAEPHVVGSNEVWHFDSSGVPVLYPDPTLTTTWCQWWERSTIPPNFHPTFLAAASSVC
jgi:hypothetical protein